MSQDLFETLEALIDASVAGRHTDVRRAEEQARRLGAPARLLSRLVEALRPPTSPIRRPVTAPTPVVALAQTLGLAVMSVEGPSVRALTPEARDYFPKGARLESMTPGRALAVFGGLSEAEASRHLHEAASSLVQNHDARLVVVKQGETTFAVRNARPDEADTPIPRVDALPVLEELLEAQRRRADHKDVQIRFHADQELQLHGRVEDIRAIASNLIANAVDAAPRGSEIRVTALCDQNEVELRVADRGSGMSTEVRRRAFEPFFSTKNSAGLGLPTVRHLVARLLGSLEIETEVAAGTTVSVRLPRVVTSESA